MKRNDKILMIIIFVNIIIGDNQVSWIRNVIATARH